MNLLKRENIEFEEFCQKSEAVDAKKSFFLCFAIGYLQALTRVKQESIEFWEAFNEQISRIKGLCQKDKGKNEVELVINLFQTIQKGDLEEAMGWIEHYSENNTEMCMDAIFQVFYCALFGFFPENDDFSIGVEEISCLSRRFKAYICVVTETLERIESDNVAGYPAVYLLREPPGKYSILYHKSIADKGELIYPFINACQLNPPPNLQINLTPAVESLIEALCRLIHPSKISTFSLQKLQKAYKLLGISNPHIESLLKLLPSPPQSSFSSPICDTCKLPSQTLAFCSHSTCLSCISQSFSSKCEKCPHEYTDIELSIITDYYENNIKLTHLHTS